MHTQISFLQLLYQHLHINHSSLIYSLKASRKLSVLHLSNNKIRIIASNINLLQKRVEHFIALYLNLICYYGYSSDQAIFILSSTNINSNFWKHVDDSMEPSIDHSWKCLGVSHGFLPHHSVASASIDFINIITKHPSSLYICDIQKAFNNIDRQKVLDILYYKYNCDPEVISILSVIFKHVSFKVDDKYIAVALKYNSYFRKQGNVLYLVNGLPQGSPVSPVLCNVLLSQIDIKYGRQDSYIRYADDIVIVGDSLFNSINSYLGSLNVWFNPDKVQHYKDGYFLKYLGLEYYKHQGQIYIVYRPDYPGMNIIARHALANGILLFEE